MFLMEVSEHTSASGTATREKFASYASSISIVFAHRNIESYAL
jgi:hypothetical protein